MVVARKPMTLEEFLALPEQKPPLELVDGEVTPKSASVAEHVVLQLQFRDLVDGFARLRKLARAFPELRESYGEFGPRRGRAVLGARRRLRRGVE